MKIEFYEPKPDRDARLIREERQALQKGQQNDPLRKRMQTVGFWTKCRETNTAYGLVHIRALYRNQGFRPYVLPRLQAFLTAREKVAKQAYQEQSRREAQAYAHKKALKKATPLSLFPEPA